MMLLPLTFNFIYGTSNTLSLHIRYACAIPDPDNKDVIITGGLDTKTTVSVYSEAGHQRDLPDLRQGRWSHACSSFTIDGDIRVKLYFLTETLLIPFLLLIPSKICQKHASIPGFIEFLSKCHHIFVISMDVFNILWM